MAEDYSSWAARWRVPLGFAMALALVVLSQPRWPTLLVGGIVGLPGLALRGAAAGWLEKGQELATQGPYGHVRNPLYLGSFIIGAGFAIAAASWILAALFVVFFLAVYLPVVRREGKELRRRFGAEYEDYSASVPALVPSLKRARAHGDSQPAAGFRWKLYRKNREYEAALGYAAGLLFLAIKMKLR